MNVCVFGASAGKNKVYHEYMKQFHKGVSLHDKSFYEPECIYRECDVAVIFGSCRIEKHKTESHMFKKDIIEHHPGRIVYIESCLLGRVAKVGLNKHWRVGVDHFLLNHGDFGFVDRPKADRLQELNLTFKKWKGSGDYILIGMQILNDASLMGQNHKVWAEETISYLLDTSTRDIKVRIHPLTKKEDYERMVCTSVFSHPRVQLSSDVSLEKDLARAHCMVTYTSGSGIDAVMAGVPSIALHKGSMVYPLSRHSLDDIENPYMPDREMHFRNLAYAQWTPKEMEEGKCWEHLKKRVFGK